jgi:hypothetical protein
MDFGFSAVIHLSLFLPSNPKPGREKLAFLLQ